MGARNCALAPAFAGLLSMVIAGGFAAGAAVAAPADAGAAAPAPGGAAEDAPAPDAVAELPARWRGELVPVSEADISGAEPLMQEAINAARRQLAALLTAPETQRQALADAYGRLGALFLLVEVEARADASLRNAMTLDPDEFRWPYYAGYLAMLAGNLEQALRYLEQARAIDPDYAPLYMRLGKVHLDRSELEQARAAFERVEDRDGLASPAHYYLGQIAVLERRFDQAVTLLERALAANPEATEVHYPLAQAQRALGNAEQARRHLQQFELRAPDIADPLLAELEAATKRSLPAFKRAIHAVRSGDYGRAAEHFRSGLDVDPDNAAARVSFARALYLDGRQRAAAEQLAQALALQPSHVLGRFLQGVLYQQQGDTVKAAASYRQALELKPEHAGARFYLANLDFDAGRYAQAAAGYERVLAADAGVAPARSLLLVASLHGGVPEGRLSARLSELLEAYPNDRQLRYAQVRLLAAAGDASLRDPRRARELAAELAVEQQSPPHQRALALAMAADGRTDEAAAGLAALIDAMGWMMPAAELQQAKRELALYRDARIPGAWPADDPLLSPPPFDPIRSFRDYPATAPY